MRAIILKEVRQLVYVGGFATLSLSGLLAFGLYANSAANLSLVDSSFQLIVSIAFATVGLSTGITYDLPPAAEIVLVLLMFLGRIGPLTLGSAIALRERRILYELPKERPAIG